MQAQIEAIRNKVQQCIALAESKFGIKMPYVQIRFDLRGRAAGMAGYRGKDFYLRFNIDHIRLGGKTYEHLLMDTVPHEVAHTVCQAFPQFGRNHDRGWQRVCLALGGNGSTRYSEEDAPEAVAAQRPWVYITTSGHEVRVTNIIHKKIQQGAGYVMKGGKGKINRECAYNYISAPAVKAAAKPVVVDTKAVPVEDILSPTVLKLGTATRTAQHKRPSVTAAKGSKAEQIRHWMRLGLSDAEIIQQAEAMFGMKAQLVKTYIKNNRSKV